jgi:hypothetical protein
MDIDHDNGLEPLEDDDLNILSQNNSATTMGLTSGREPLSKYYIYIYDQKFHNLKSSSR